MSGTQCGSKWYIAWVWMEFYYGVSIEKKVCAKYKCGTKALAELGLAPDGEVRIGRIIILPPSPK